MQAEPTYQPWLKPAVDTTETMAAFLTFMAGVSAEEQKIHRGRKVDLPLSMMRTVDESLLDIDAMEELMLPFCSEPFEHPVRKLAKLSIMFMQTPHYKKCVELGWRDIDLFGVSPRDLSDSRPKGLLPSLAWTRFTGKLRGVDREGAKIQVLRKDGSVSSLQMWRPHPCPGTVPFWESKALGSAP